MTAATDSRASRAAPVVLEGVRKEYEGGVVAVHGVDLTVHAGEFVVLVGPSGCGKSTTLRMVAGLETITAGRLSIAGRVVNDVPPSDRDIAMVFQSYALYPHMSVRENMAFALKLRKRPAAEIAERVEAAATTLGLESMLDRTPRQLSGGQRQRVAIGRAIVREPSVFLFDEPLSNLDAALRSEMRRELATLHRRLGATMLYVTHDQVEAMTLGDRIVVMHEGRVRQVDTPAQVYDRPHDTFVAGFLGSPPMNLLAGTLVQRDGRWFVRLTDAPDLQLGLPPVLARAAEHASSREVTVGVRPEHLTAQPVPPGSATPPDGLLATVELAEPLGHEQLLHLHAGGVSFTVRGAPGVRPEVGSLVAVRLSPDRLHLFDTTSGVSLTA
ncbi:MAG TPA: sn-glycerol-3-phosphate ABC transporter ATP-binding protein UgpC [Gemmatimonadaceae bacterium]|nr:sn-glycerol-3-phosphate ABC transporter ATP-binding protein UgpC [Gemmatimonadaceae bacterium]